MAGAHRCRMQRGDPNLSPAVPLVLTEEIRKRLPAVPLDPQLGVEQQLVAGGSNPPVELEVLVHPESFVPPAETAGEVGGVGAERDVLRRLGPGAVVVSRVPDAER